MDTFNRYSKAKSLEWCKEKHRDVFPTKIVHQAKLEITFGKYLEEWLDENGKTSFDEEVDMVDFLQSTALKADESADESILQSVSWCCLAFMEDLSLADWLIERELFELDFGDFQHLVENDYKYKIQLSERLLQLENYKEFVLSSKTAFEASCARDWEFLEFLLKNKCSTNIAIFGPPALDGNLSILQMLKDNGCSFKPNDFIEPFSNSSLAVIDWFAENMEVEEIQKVEQQIIRYYTS